MAPTLPSLAFLLPIWLAEANVLISFQEAYATLDCLLEDENDGVDGLVLLQRRAKAAVRKLNSSRAGGDATSPAVGGALVKLLSKLKLNSSSGDGDARSPAVGGTLAKLKLNFSSADGNAQMVNIASGTLSTEEQRSLIKTGFVKALDDDDLRSAYRLQKQYGSLQSIDPEDPDVLLETMKQRREYELKSPDVPTYNKIILSLLEVFVLTGCLGVDRCYMGQTCLGVVKGLTFGGLGVWYMIDYVTIMVNCLGFGQSIDFLGFVGNFTSGSIFPAFVIALVGVILKIVSFCGYGCWRFSAHGQEDASDDRIVSNEKLVEKQAARNVQTKAESGDGFINPHVTKAQNGNTNPRTCC